MGRKKSSKTGIKHGAEAIVQDLIADFSVKEITERHKCTKHWVYQVTKDNCERIEAARQKYTDQRQKEIDAAFKREIERTTEAIEASGKGVLRAIDELIAQLDSDNLSASGKRDACQKLADLWSRLRDHVEKRRGS